MTHCWQDAFETEARVAEELDTGETTVDALRGVELLGAYPYGATCMLPEGHDGPHIYTPNDLIEMGICVVDVRKGEAA
jgi:hypothetical protein